MAIPIQTLFHTKAKELWECPQRYYWRNHAWLVPKQKNPNFERGSYVHQLMNTAILLGESEPNLPSESRLALAFAKHEGEYVMSEEVREEAKSMALELWDRLQSFKIVETEFSIELDIGDGYIWKSKLDSIIEAPEGGLWQGEYKSTKTYASNLKRLYHTSIQPFLYLYSAREKGFDLQGTKMFVADKKQCVVEDVVSTPQQLKEAERFILETKERVMELEERGKFPRNRTACISLISECPYRALCIENASPSYIEECASLLYIKESPIAHYGEGA